MAATNAEQRSVPACPAKNIGWKTQLSCHISQAVRGCPQGTQRSVTFTRAQVLELYDSTTTQHPKQRLIVTNGPPSSLTPLGRLVVPAEAPPAAECVEDSRARSKPRETR